MKTILTIVALTSMSVIAVENQSTLCTAGEQQRKIELVYPQGTELPCEVQYTKSDNMQILWSASGEAGFCEAKYEAFVEKQRSWGWLCESSSTEQQQQEPAGNESDPAEPETEDSEYKSN